MVEMSIGEQGQTHLTILKGYMNLSRADLKWLRVLVCGGRDFGRTQDEHYFVKSQLDLFASQHSILFNPDDNWLPNDIIIINGAAKGVDEVSSEWAIVNWCKYFEFPANWKKYGKAAGHIRNKQMLNEGKPDVVLAFPGGKGTANMVKQAEESGIPVIRVTRG
jgi:hypothetical protein